MTEHDRNLPNKNIMVVKTGSQEFPGTNLKSKWELHALADYVESDIELSHGVMENLASYLQEKGWSDTTIELAEGYDNEEEGEEHYRLSIVFNEGNDNNKVTFSKGYSAQTEEGEVKGLVRVRAGLSSDSADDHKELAKKIAGLYIEEMEKTYTDWENQWGEDQVVENST